MRSRKAILGRGSLVLALMLALAACKPLYQNHGYVPVAEDLKLIEVGKTTREEITTLIGPPSVDEFIAGGAWYYVQSRFRHYAWKEPEEIDRRVMAISFTADGRVANVEEFGLEKGRIVQLSTRVTETTVRERSALAQIFGAIGNFSADQVIDSGN